MGTGKILVQKYGGSSISTRERRKNVAAKITAAQEQGYSLVVVLSAMGRFPDTFATDTLIGNLEEEGIPLDAKEKDLIMSCGETISCVIMAAIMRASGKKAVALTGFGADIVTDRQFGEAQILSINTSRITQLLKDGLIVFVTGFQGISQDLEITTLGRGGSDTSATALGAGLKAERVEIYTDVDGVMTADPRVFPGAHVIRELSYQEMGEMASEGAKVLHSRCVDISKDHDIPLVVKSSFSDDRGSTISSVIPDRAKTHEGMVTGLIHKTGITEFIVDLSGVKPLFSIHWKLFEDIADRGISLDLINVCYDTLYFTTEKSCSDRIKKYFDQSSLPCRTIDGLAKISSVGIGMKGTPGVMARICDVLASAGVNIHRSVDSFINISCLVEEKDLFTAMKALHDRFRLGDTAVMQETGTPKVKTV